MTDSRVNTDWPTYIQSHWAENTTFSTNMGGNEGNLKNMRQVARVKRVNENAMFSVRVACIIKISIQDMHASGPKMHMLSSYESLSHIISCHLCILCHRMVRVRKLNV